MVKEKRAHRTYHNYRSQIRNHICPAFGKKKLRALRLDNIEGLYKRMLACGLSPDTVRSVHSVLSGALSNAVTRRLVPYNVAERAWLPGLEQAKTEALSAEEAKKLLGAAEGAPLEALYVLAVTCGLRQGELLRLRWEDVDLEARTLTVRRQLQRSRDGSGLLYVPTKKQEESCDPAWSRHRQRSQESPRASSPRDRGDQRPLERSEVGVCHQEGHAA